MSRITRKELKTDKFALEVEHTVSLFEEHRQEVIRYGGIAAVVVALIVGYTIYSRSQHAVREQALAHAIEVQEAPVGQSGSGGMSFPTQEAKDAEATKVFGDLKNKYSGSAEAADRVVLSGVDTGRPGQYGAGGEELSGSGAARRSRLRLAGEDRSGADLFFRRTQRNRVKPFCTI